MYCGKCGNQIKAGSGFCEKCGAKIEEKNSKKKKSNKPLIIIMAFVAIIVVGILAVGKIGNKDLEQENVAQNVSNLDEELFQNANNSDEESLQNENHEEQNDEIEEKKQILKSCETEHYDGSITKIENNELGDVILQIAIFSGQPKTFNYRWEYIGDSKKAYLEDGTLAIEKEIDEKGNVISEKIYRDNMLTRETYYEYDDAGDSLKTSKNYYYREKEGLYLDAHIEYGKDGNVATQRYVYYSYDYENGEPTNQHIDEFFWEYNEYGELISEKHFRNGETERSTIYKNQRSQDGKSCIGRAYVYEGENQELIEEYDAYAYEYDESGNMVSKCDYNSEGEVVERTYREYNENGSLLSDYFYRGDTLESITKYTYYE